MNYWYYKEILRSKCEIVNITGLIHEPDHTIAFVKDCVADATQSTLQYSNLPKGLDKFFNVHKCDVGKIPFAFVSAGG